MTSFKFSADHLFSAGLLRTVLFASRPSRSRRGSLGKASCIPTRHRLPSLRPTLSVSLPLDAFEKAAAPRIQVHCFPLWTFIWCHTCSRAPPRGSINQLSIGCSAEILFLMQVSKASFNTLICPSTVRFSLSIRPLLCDSPAGDCFKSDFAGARFLLKSLGRSMVAGCCRFST